MFILREVGLEPLAGKIVAPLGFGFELCYDPLEECEDRTIVLEHKMLSEFGGKITELSARVFNEIEWMEELAPQWVLLDVLAQLASVELLPTNPNDWVGDILLLVHKDVCACGCPDDAVRAIKTVLGCYHHFEDSEEYKKEIYPQWKTVWENNETGNLKLLVTYLLDALGYLEHGSSVAGAGLTAKGLLLRCLLNFVKEEE